MGGAATHRSRRAETKAKAARDPSRLRASSPRPLQGRCPRSRSLTAVRKRRERVRDDGPDGEVNSPLQRRQPEGRRYVSEEKRKRVLVILSESEESLFSSRLTLQRDPSARASG